MEMRSLSKSENIMRCVVENVNQLDKLVWFSCGASGGMHMPSDITELTSIIRSDLLSMFAEYTKEFKKHNGIKDDKNEESGKVMRKKDVLALMMGNDWLRQLLQKNPLASCTCGSCHLCAYRFVEQNCLDNCSSYDEKERKTDVQL